MTKWAMVVGTIWTVVGFTIGGGVAWAQQRPVLPPPVSAGPPSAVSPQEQIDPPPRKPISPEEAIASPDLAGYPYPVDGKPSFDSKTIIQQKAAQEAEQRANRRAARKWFGFSNSRPVAGVDCIHGDYAPRWTSNHPHYPFRWVGVGGGVVSWLPAIPSSRTGETQP